MFKALLEQSEIMNQLIVAEVDSNVADVKLNTAMYRPPRTPIQLRGRSFTAGWYVHCFCGLDDLALANRPELSGAEERSSGAERMYELADRNRKYPDFHGGMGLCSNADGNEKGSIRRHGQYHYPVFSVDGR